LIFEERTIQKVAPF